MPSGIDIDNNNNIYTTGSFIGTFDFDPGANVYDLTNTGSGLDSYILKLSTIGDLMWVKAIQNGMFYDLSVDNDNNVYAVGPFSGTIDFDPGSGIFVINNLSSETVLSKLNTNGNFICASAFRTIGGGSNFGRAMTTDPAQNIYITGELGGITDFDPGPIVYTLYSGPSYSPFVLKLSKCTNITTSTLNINTCNSYILNNEIFNTSGTYIRVIPNSTGCDSVITLNLTINRKFTDQIKTICEGQTYYAGGANQTSSGIYKDTLLTSLGCDSVITTTLTVNPKPKPDLGPDRNLCTNTQATITPGSFNSYFWQDNSTQPFYIVSIPGKYWVTVTNANNCSATDTLNIISIDTIPKNFLPADQDLCYGNVLRIAVPNYFTYQCQLFIFRNSGQSKAARWLGKF